MNKIQALKMEIEYLEKIEEINLVLEAINCNEYLTLGGCCKINDSVKSANVQIPVALLKGIIEYLQTKKEMIFSKISELNENKECRNA